MKSVRIGYFVCFLLVSFCFCGCEEKEISPEVKIFSAHNWTADSVTMRAYEETYYPNSFVLEYSMAFSESGNIRSVLYCEIKNNANCRIYTGSAVATFEMIDNKYSTYSSNSYDESTILELTESKFKLKSYYSTYFSHLPEEESFVACPKSTPIPIPSEWECVDCSDVLKSLLKARFTFKKSGFLYLVFASGEIKERTCIFTIGGNVCVTKIILVSEVNCDGFFCIQRSDVEGRDITMKSLQTKEPMAGTYMRLRRID